MKNVVDQYVQDYAVRDARPVTHLPPRSFETPKGRFVVWFGGKRSEALGAGNRVGAHLDLQSFVPIVAAVVLVIGLPLILILWA